MRYARTPRPQSRRAIRTPRFVANRLLLLLLSLTLLLGGTGSLMAQVRMAAGMDMGTVQTQAGAAVVDPVAGEDDCHGEHASQDTESSGHEGHDMHGDETCLKLCLTLCLHSCNAVFGAQAQFPAPAISSMLLPEAASAPPATPSSPPIRPPIA